MSLVKRMRTGGLVLAMFALMGTSLVVTQKLTESEAKANPCPDRRADICLEVTAEPSTRHPIYVPFPEYSGLPSSLSSTTRIGGAGRYVGKMDVPEIVASTMGGGTPFPGGFARTYQIPGNWIFTGEGGFLPLGGSALAFTATLEQPWTGHIGDGMGVITGDLELQTGASLTQVIGWDHRPTVTEALRTASTRAWASAKYRGDHDTAG